jgi:hypothetical protein
MRKILNYILVSTATAAVVALMTTAGAGPAAAAGPNPNPIVTIGNVPLPVQINNVPLPVAGAVTVTGTPTVSVSNLPRKVPYHFRVTVEFDGSGSSGDNRTHTIPEGKIFEMKYIACSANTGYENGNPLRLSLQGGSHMGMVVINVPQRGGYNRDWAVSQPVHGFLGDVGPLDVGSTVTLFATLHDIGDNFGIADCYISGDLIIS